MKPTRRGKTWVALVIASIGVLIAWFSQRDAGKSPPVVQEAKTRDDTRPERAAKPAAGSFDFYLMALTVHPAFCADGHERMRECQVSSHRALVIHGLWPERDQPGTYPRDCPGPPLDLEGSLKLELADFMPGVADELDEHEWRQHGRCSGLDDDEYFGHALRLTRRVDAALSARLTTLAGRETTASELRGTVDAFDRGLGATLTFHCRTLADAPTVRHRQHYLVEVRQCVDNDGPRGAPKTPLDCAAVKRRDQGCGHTFRIAGADDR